MLTGCERMTLCSFCQDFREFKEIIRIRITVRLEIIVSLIRVQTNLIKAHDQPSISTKNKDTNVELACTT